MSATKRTYFSLLQLNKSIRNLIEGIQKTFWVSAEVSQVQYRNHIYLELVHKQEDSVVANNRAQIWANRIEKVQEQAGNNLEALLAEGNKVLVEVLVTYHEVYGLSLNILNIDPSFTIGELEQQRLATLKKLEENGLLTLQQQLAAPTVPQRLAVVSSATAAGLSDFLHQLSHTPQGYVFHIHFFEVAVQGNHATAEIVQALHTIEESAHLFDAIVLIRGGGSRLDLEVFNQYAIAETIAQSSLPVFTGIGHQRDQTIADSVAHYSLKTPTAVAEHLIQQFEQFDALLAKSTETIAQTVLSTLHEEKELLTQYEYHLQTIIRNRADAAKQQLQSIQWGIRHSVLQQLLTKKHQLERLEQQLYHSIPSFFEKKGYYRVRKGQQVLYPKQLLVVGDRLIIEREGEQITVRVEEVKSLN